jgi:ech hydrogenase subunit C
VFKKLIKWARTKSPWVLHFNSGACNACDIEILAALMPHYDLERFGVQLKATPRHADVLLCSGPVTKQIAPRLKRIYEQMPEPKWVIAMGACASTGGMYRSYAVLQGIDRLLPVDVYVAGCPPRPEALLDALIKLQEKVAREPALAMLKKVA